MDSAAQQELRPPGQSQGQVTGATRDQEGTHCLPEFLTPILAHELLHLRRGDLLTGVLQALAQCFWWFHPAVWYTNRWLSREAERCCDEQVIAELGCSPAEYARSLLSVIECRHQLHPVPVFPGMKPVEITSQRMERIMSLKNGLKKRTPVWCWLAIAVLALVVLPGAADRSKTVAQEPEILQSKQQNDELSGLATNKAPKIGVTPRAETSESDEFVEQSEQKLRELLETKVSMRFHQRSVQSVVRSIAEEYGLHIAITASAIEYLTWDTVEYHCENEPLLNALESIAEQLGMKMTIVHGIIHFELPSIRSRIRVNESLVLTNQQMPSSDAVIAFVGEVPIRVSDLLVYPSGDFHIQPLRDSDSRLREEYPSEYALTLWLKLLHERFPNYLAQEVFLQHLKQHLPPEVISTGESDAEPEVVRIIQHQHLRLKTTNDQELDAKLAQEFSSISLIKKYFQRSLTLNLIIGRLYKGDRPFFKDDDIVDYGETILMEARFRKQVSMKYKDSDFLRVIRSISGEHDVPIRLAPLHAEMAIRLSNPPVTVDIRDQTLSEAVRLIVEPRGMTATLTAKGLSIQHTAPETITQEFLSASPAAYGIFGLVSKTGWQPLTTEIRLKDAIALAGGVADPTNLDVEICHLKHRKTPDGLQRHRILSLNSVLEDASGEYNCVLNDGDVVTVRIDPNARTSVPVNSVGANAAKQTP
ncbi:MAG: M56 family metallopeptidase, partial [Planctomyces sp.]